MSWWILCLVGFMLVMTRTNAEIFSSTANIELLVAAQDMLIEELETYVRREETRLETIRRWVQYGLSTSWINLDLFVCLSVCLSVASSPRFVFPRFSRDIASELVQIWLLVLFGASSSFLDNMWALISSPTPNLLPTWLTHPAVGRANSAPNHMQMFAMCIHVASILFLYIHQREKNDHILRHLNSTHFCMPCSSAPWGSTSDTDTPTISLYDTLFLPHYSMWTGAQANDPLTKLLGFEVFFVPLKIPTNSSLELLTSLKLCHKMTVRKEQSIFNFLWYEKKKEETTGAMIKNSLVHWYQLTVYISLLYECHRQ